MKHSQVDIITSQGKSVVAQAPIIISASRATDIPAFYCDWFFNRLEQGYLAWRNPFSGKFSYVSFAKTRFIIFCSKNPKPLLPLLQRLEECGIGCYIQYTLNDYDAEGVEPNVPPMTERIDTFKHLVDMLGAGSVVWRFDPLLLTDHIDIDDLLERVRRVGDALSGYTEKLVFSFADIACYSKVARNLKAHGINYREWDDESMLRFADELCRLNAQSWHYELATCAEPIALESYGISHNRCIDPELISRLASHDAALQNFLYNARKDPGQRKLCGCILAKDIGSYNTCPHGCAYCYANTSSQAALDNYNRHPNSPNRETII